MLRLFLGAALLAAPALAMAQPRVSEREFLDALRDSYPGAIPLAERVESARAERVRAGLLSNPTANFEREAPGGVEQITWQLAWTPPLDGRRGAAVRAADAGLRAASAQLDFDRLSLRSELRQIFAEWAITSERRQVVDTHWALIRRLAEQMEARASRGEESQLGARRLALAALEVEVEAERTAAEAVRAREMAAILLDLGPTGALPERPPLPEVTDTSRTQPRGDLLARRYEVEEAEWRLRSGRRFLQFPELAFGWQQVRDRGTDDGPVLAVSWPLPFFDRRQPERIQATARLASARARLQLAIARAEADRIATTAAYVRLREAALRGMQTIAESERALESATATYRLGESRLTDLLETLRSILSARLSALDLYAAALEAHRELELAVGRPLGTEDR